MWLLPYRSRAFAPAAADDLRRGEGACCVMTSDAVTTGQNAAAWGMGAWT
jgi:hypothetical protein